MFMKHVQVIVQALQLVRQSEMISGTRAAREAAKSSLVTEALEQMQPTLYLMQKYAEDVHKLPEWVNKAPTYQELSACCLELIQLVDMHADIDHEGTVMTQCRSMVDSALKRGPILNAQKTREPEPAKPVGRYTKALEGINEAQAVQASLLQDILACSANTERSLRQGW